MQLCKITSTNPKVVTKEFWLSDGKLEKKTTAHVSEGAMEIVSLDGIEAFSELLQNLQANQCLTYGIPPVDANLLSMKKWQKLGKPSGFLPRAKEIFKWPVNGGVMMLDYDAPKDGSAPLDKEGLLNALRQAIPDLDMFDAAWWPSTSSCIYEGETEHRGIAGQRVYLHAADASDIERAGKALNTRLWSLGYGRFEVSSSGSLLERGMFDSTVWQTNRIDFAAGAACGQGLAQRRGAPEFLGGYIGGAIDTKTAIPDPSTEEIEAAERNKELAKSAVQDEAQCRRQEWMTERIEEIIKRDGVTEEHARMIASRAVDRRDLMGDWQVICKGDDGQEVSASVLTILDNPERYHGMLTLDPLEPDYDGRRWVGKLFLYSARPTLHSMAHGGVRFRLTRQPARIEVVGGKGREATDALLDVLRRAPDVFDFGNELVSIGRSGTICPANEHGLRYTVGGLTQFWRWHKLPQGGGSIEMLLDPPANICKSVLALGNQRELKPLDAVITAPTLRPDGSVLSSPGYDLSTRLLFDAENLPPDIPEFPNREQGLAALEYLWKPFADFPFVGNLDRAVHLAALLTAAVRAVLPTSPAFGYDAPVQGSGKTLLARCVGVLATGEDPGVWPHTAGRDDEEVRKRIFTVLRSGARAIIWDNVVGSFDSAAMASAITSPNFQDRILGASSSSSVPNRAMLILTGNNLTLAGEMPRRVLVARIDPETDRPFSRHFNIDPFEVCQSERQTMIAAALVLIRAYLNNSAGPLGEGKLASFEMWDAWVRQSVIYANALMPGKFGDVMEVIQANQDQDPEQETLGILLDAWQRNFGTEYKFASDVMAVLKTGYLCESSIAGQLNDAVSEVYGKGAITARSLGRTLGYRAGRVVNGKRLVFSMDRTTKLKKWAVEVVK